jgi:hypothetical protein
VARFKIETGDEGIKMNWVYLRCDKLALWLCGGDKATEYGPRDHDGLPVIGQIRTWRLIRTRR